MIKIDMTVREAVNLALYCSAEMREKIVTALENAMPKEQNNVTITGGMSTDNRIHCMGRWRRARAAP